MYKLYLNIVSFIKFSKIDPEFKPANEKEILTLINNKLPIDIEIGKILIRFMYKDSKNSTDQKIITFINRKAKSYDKLVLIKNTWVHKKYKQFTNIHLLTHSDMSYDIEPMNRNDVKVLSKEEIKNEFDLHFIDVNRLPKITLNDPVAKWLMLKVGDIISYYIYYDGNRAKKFRICIDHWVNLSS